tara:strand:- start:642 stop:1604 length:963 start_codon:yes stop_codon:yes gene_type:complete
MGFHEQAVFPSKIAVGSTFGPGFNTAVVEVRGGAETRTGYYETPRHLGDISRGIDTWDDLMLIKQFYIARLGAAYGFRFPDPGDYTSAANGYDVPTPTDQLIGDTNGALTSFQLRKQYQDGGVIRNRSIQKPIETSVRVALDNVEVLTGWSVDDTTGVILFTSPPAGGQTLKAGFEFHVPCRFDDDSDKGLLTSFNEFRNGNLQPIGIIELIDERPTDDEAYRGGSKTFTMTTDVAVTPATGLLIRAAPDQDNLRVVLPITQYLESGGPYFYIQNNQATYNLIVATAALDTVATLAPTEVYQLLISDQAGVKTWFALGPI